MSIKENKEIIVLTIFAVIFFFIYSYLPLSQLTQSSVPINEVSLRFNTPDEVMNYYFTQLYSETGKMYYEEPLNLIAGGVIFPRWAKPIGDKITPGTFQGIILIYGSIAKIAGKWVMPFLTPLFAVIGVLFFYLFIKIIFNKQIAFISACLMFIFPGFWYYSSRTLFHNILFLSLLIIGLYFLFHTNQPRKVPRHNLGVLRSRHKHENKYTQIFRSAASGLFIGLALITRTSEIVWLGALILITILFYRRSMKKQKCFLCFCVFCVFVMVCFIPVLYHNKILYGSYLSTGYNAVVSENLEDLSQIKKISLTQAIFLPFGFHPRVIVTHVLNKYFIQLFWPWIIWFLAGLIIFFKQKRTMEQKLYFYIFIFLSFYIFIYYGSWFFQDSLNPNLISLGSSYVRYFLPVYVFSLPFIALAIAGFYQIIKTKNKILAKTAILIPYSLLLITCILSVYFKGPESLLNINNNLLNYRIQAQDVLTKTNLDDIILTDVSNDKIIFPEHRHLIVPQGGDELRSLPFLLKLSDVYFFYRSSQVNAKYLNEIKFNPYGLEIYDEQEINGGGVLFKIKEREEHYSLKN